MLWPMGSQRVRHNWATEVNWTEKGQRNQRSNCQHPLNHQKIKRAPEKKIYFCFTDYEKAFDSVDNSKLWNILKDMGIPDHLNCCLINLYAGQEATVRTRHGTADWFQIWKGVGQGCILSPCLFNFYEEFIMWKSRLDEAHAGNKIARRNINNFRYTRWHLLYGKKQRIKESLDESERGEWTSWQKLSSQKTKIMASGPITSWLIDGETMETVRDYFLGLQNHCRWWLQPWN